MRPTLFLKQYLRHIGYDIVKFKPWSHPVAQRKALFSTYGIDLVLDVGANTGDFAEELRSFGYKGRILSFEPLRDTFKILQARASRDPHWDVRNEALGDVDAERPIHVSRNTLSSSLLDMNDLHANCEPDSRYVATESIQVRRLDSVLPTLRSTAQSMYLKIDTQGYERWVLDGAPDSLTCIDTLQVETSLMPLYDGSMLFEELLARLSTLNYRLVGVETVFTNPVKGESLQLDIIFHRDQPS